MRVCCRATAVPGKRYALLPGRSGFPSAAGKRSTAAATLTDRATFWCMSRRQSFILLCSSSPLSEATGQPSLSFVTPAEPTRRCQAAAAAASAPASGTGESSSLHFRTFRFSFVLTVFVCSRPDSGIISHDSGTFTVAVLASLPGARVPRFLTLGRMPESLPPDGNTPVRKLGQAAA